MPVPPNGTANAPPAATQATADLTGANTAATTGAAQAAPQAGTTVLTATPQQTRQEQLAQLDRVLESMGVDPQRMPMFNQLAMLQYLNDPSGLQHFIQQLHALTPFPPTTTVTAPASTPSPSANQVSLQAVANSQGAAPASGFASQVPELKASLEATQPVRRAGRRVRRGKGWTSWHSAVRSKWDTA